MQYVLKLVTATVFIVVFTVSLARANSDGFQLADIGEAAGKGIQSIAFGAAMVIGGIGKIVLYPFFEIEKAGAEKRLNHYETHLEKHIIDDNISVSRHRNYLTITLSVDTSFEKETLRPTKDLMQTLDIISEAVMNDDDTHIILYNYQYHIDRKGGSVYDNSPRIFNKTNNYDINRFCKEMSDNTFSYLRNKGILKERLVSESCADTRKTANPNHNRRHRSHQFAIRLRAL